MASVLGRWEVAMKEGGGLEEAWIAPSVSVFMRIRDDNRLLSRKAEFSALSLCLYF